MWTILRNKRINGFIFRQQHAIGPYVVDFVCLKKKFVIEVDGGQHAAMSEVIADTDRTKWLEGQGYRVLRVWNNEVMKNTQGVVEMIGQCLSDGSPSPLCPSPLKGRGGYGLLREAPRNDTRGYAAREESGY